MVAFLCFVVIVVAAVLLFVVVAAAAVCFFCLFFFFLLIKISYMSEKNLNIHSSEKHTVKARHFVGVMQYNRHHVLLINSVSKCHNS